ncbi:1325_t:CDS:2 [Diversispora eburnea]|uniref:1325_t:CDS:1 n=1 Tax=Diversispora eburnea TaxID=1213867 RepID=A0A9N9FPZ7_9GLOM|nr:1325_t:CDS:2 [Diversispora eburnea]
MDSSIDPTIDISSQPRYSSIPMISTTTFISEEEQLNIQQRINRGFTTPIHGTTSKRGYKKPSKPREFAKSAKKRQSVMALGSITHLQHYYAKRDIETDPDVLLANCHSDIQTMLEAWSMVTGEVKAEENPVPVDILVAIETTTKTIQSVKNYSMVKEDLSDDSLSKIRVVTLEVLEMISNLEKEHRYDDTDDSSSEDGHIYKESNYRYLDAQRESLRKYLQVVEDNLLFDDKELYQNVSYLRSSEINGVPITPPLSPGYPLSPGHPNSDWINPEVFGDNLIGRYHAFLEAHRPSKSKRSPNYTPLPNPNDDKTEFLAALADGKLLCIIYNTVIRRSKRPFGFIDKIHEDTTRTYRATENLKFFAAAVKFRFDVKFDEFNASEMFKLTTTGKIQLEKILGIFCEKAMEELISTGSYKQHPLSRVSSMYLQESFSNSQIQLLQQATNSAKLKNLDTKMSYRQSWGSSDSNY